VSTVEADEGWDSLARRAGIAAVIEARVAIEAEAAFLAATRATHADAAAILAALAVRGDQIGVAERYVDADMEFHRRIVVVARNPILLEMFDAFAGRSREAMIDLVRMERAPDIDLDHDVHRGVADAIADGDADLAATRARAHLQTLHALLEAQATPQAPSSAGSSAKTISSTSRPTPGA
jgi:DNA-binding FadR family transcriptional regulator